MADSADSDSEIPTEVRLLYCRYCKCCGFAAKNCFGRKELIFFNNVSRPPPGAERGRDHVHRSNSTCWGDSIGIARCCLGSTRCVEGGPTRPLFEGNLAAEVTPKSGEATRRSNTLESCAGSPEANSGTERDMCSDAMKLKLCKVESTCVSICAKYIISRISCLDSGL